jgi:NADH:ubiquinone oxidoreductase subunit 3 (subunit A)
MATDVLLVLAAGTVLLLAWALVAVALGPAGAVAATAVVACLCVGYAVACRAGTFDGD